MNRIVTAKCSQLRALARQSLTGFWPEAVLFVLVCRLIINVPSMLFETLPEQLQSQFLASFLNCYSIFINGPMSLALAHYCIRIFRMEKHVCTQELKFGFTYIIKGILLYARMVIQTFLWSCLFVVPGFIAAIRYSQAFLILADDPSKSPSKCLYESCFIMRGNKMKYFRLVLSFLPWFLLAAIPGVIAHGLLDTESIMAMTNSINAGNFEMAAMYAYDISPVVDVLNFLDVIPTAYLNVTMVAFFDILCGKLIIQNEQ